MATGLSSAALAQTQSDDIVGVKLGMTADEVRAALKAHDPAMKVIDYAKRNARPGVPASLARFLAAVRRRRIRLRRI